jgi:hypothetical protein
MARKQPWWLRQLAYIVPSSMFTDYSREFPISFATPSPVSVLFSLSNQIDDIRNSSVVTQNPPREVDQALNGVAVPTEMPNLRQSDTSASAIVSSSNTAQSLEPRKSHILPVEDSDILE